MKKILYSILICLLLAVSAYSADLKYESYLPPFQGLNTSISPMILSPLALTEAKNIIYDNIGSRIKRGGQVYLNESSLSESSGGNTIYGLFDFCKKDTEGNESCVLLCAADQKLYKMESFDGTFDELSSGAFTLDKQVSEVVFRKTNTTTDIVVFVNGTERPYYWNQTDSAVSLLPNTPTGVDFYPSCIESHRNRLWAAGVPSYPYRIYFSAEGKHDDWNTADDAGYIDILDKQGSKITGLAGNYFNYLVVFTENSIFLISGSSYADFAVQPLFEGLGAVNSKGIVKSGNALYFVSRKGVHELGTVQQYGDIKESFLSAQIQDDFEKMPDNYLKNCCGVAWPDKNYLMWSFAGEGSLTNNVCYVYDSLNKLWSTFDNINASSFAIVKNTSSDLELLSGNYDGFVNRLNTLDRNDNDNSIEFRISTPYLSCGDPISTKVFRRLWLFFYPQGEAYLTVYYEIDNQATEELTYSLEGTGPVLGSFILGVDALGAGTLTTKSKALKGKGKTIKLTFSQDNANIGCNLYGYAIEYMPTGIDYSE